MPKYYVNGILYKGSGEDVTVYRTGDEIDLTEEQAAALGSKVIPAAVADPSKPISEMLVKELRPLAKSAGIEGYSTMDRGELVAALEGLAVTPNESDSAT